MDDNGDRRLSQSEMKYGLRDFGVLLSNEEVDLIFKYFDTDHNGSINFDEFLYGLTGPLNARRERLVMQAFAALDKFANVRTRQPERFPAVLAEVLWAAVVVLALELVLLPHVRHIGAQAE